jgi:hypothetical protein
MDKEADPTSEKRPASAPEVLDSPLSELKKRQLEADFRVERDDSSFKEEDAIAEIEANEQRLEENSEDGDEGKDEDEGDTSDYDDTSGDSNNTEMDKPGRPNIVKRFFKGYWRHKKWTLLLTLLVIAGALFATPWSRYFILGKFVEKTYSVELLDTKTNSPISGASLSINGSKAVTDAKGKAILHAKVGKRDLKIDKKYYNTYTASVFVGLATQKSAMQIQLVATGRQVPVVVLNKLTGKPVANATLKAVGTEVKTDKDGKATVVLPADKPTLSGTITYQGYNNAKITIQVTESPVKENEFKIVPAGKLYFLSKLSGKIDVVKTDLDGSNRETVIAGTGKEDDGNTVLLASRDWKYLALQSKRDSGVAKLYLIDTSTDKMTTMDEGDATFSLAGWSNHVFAYSVTRNKVDVWQPNRLAVKTYDADKKQILTVDQNEAQGDSSNYVTQYLESFYLLHDKLVYVTRWYGPYTYQTNALADKTNSIREVTVGTTTKKDVKTFPPAQYYVQRVIPYKSDELYFDLYNQTDSKEHYFEYSDGSVSQVSDADQEKISENATYPTYLSSPQDDKTFWSEQRDGQDTFFVGDTNGENGKQVAALDEYQVYGWYTDDYLLVSTKGSELFIIPAAGGTPVKVTDYHKPQLSYRGYGGGYGGL